jgi:Skp family chaperone for outer membrane proteins
MRNFLQPLFALLLVAAALVGQVGVKKGAVVYHGSASNTSAPATVQESKVKEATPEWKRIQAESIDTESAHGKQLLVQMNNRIREAVKSVAESEGRDMVTRKDDITDAQGRSVVDLTDKVVTKVAE